MNYKYTFGERVFNIVNITALGLIALTMLYPFIYTLSISLSAAGEASRVGLHLYPREVSLKAYQMVLSDAQIIRGFVNSVVRALVGTFLTLVMCCLAAYPLAHKGLPHRRAITLFILFTMVFSGGVAPSYLLVNKLGLINTLWALVVPGMLTAFNIIVLKNFFQTIPPGFAESARIDGASELSILTKIYIPLSTPALATIALWTAVGHWNQWFDAMLYITDDHKQVLQVFLQRIVIENSTYLLERNVSHSAANQFTPDTIKAATVVVTIVPIILVYPFLQKYFMKGITLGGIKE